MPDSALVRLPNRRASDAALIEAPSAIALEADEQVNLREVARKLWRRKWPILATITTLMVLTTVVVFALTPIYRAETFVMLDARQAKVANIEEVLAGLSPDNEAIQSEIQVVRSRDLAKETIAKLALDRDPEFNEDLQPTSSPSLFGKWTDKLLGRSEEEASIADQASANQNQLSRIVDKFLTRLAVMPEPQSRVLRISFDSKSPRTAAMVLSTLVDFYLASQTDAKFQATKQANTWLNERLSGLREQVVASEAAVEAFRKEAGLLRSRAEGGKDTTIATEELSGINMEFVRAQGDRAGSEAKLRQVQSVLGSSADVGTLSAVLQSPIIQSLVEQRAHVERRAAELSAQFGESYPSIVSVRAEVRDINRKIEAETAKIVKSLQNDVSIARAREATLAANLNEAKARIARLDEADVHLRALERDADANRTLYANFLERSKETGSELAESHQPDARVISSADVPIKPVFPKKGIILGLAFIIASIAGFAVAFLLERLDQGFRSMDQIEALIGLTPLGLIPTLKRSAMGCGRVHSRLVEHGATPFAEAFRSLATKLLLLNREGSPKTLLVASSLPREGKTTVAVSLAYLQASLGRKVAFVDCDLRKPSAHAELNVPLKPGLVEYLSGQASIQQICYRENRCGVTIVPAGDPTRDPAGLLGSQAMKTLLAKLAEMHDLIVLDSAPTLAVSDALALCRFADKTVFLIRWAETRQAVAIRGLRALVDAGADIAGVLLSIVDVKKHASYGYADSGLYYGRIREYYGRR